jgi:hypothetical protein
METHAAKRVAGIIAKAPGVSTQVGELPAETLQPRGGIATLISSQKHI